MEDRLIELLRSADGAMPPLPSGHAEFAERVRMLARRRRMTRARLAGAALAAALAVALGAGMYTRCLRHADTHGGGPALVDRGRSISPEEVQRVAQEVDQLAAEVDSALALVKAVRARQDGRALAMTLDAALDPMDRADQELNRAAFTMVYQADRMYRELGLKDAAVRDYRQTIQAFPQTQWAHVARERLAQIEATHGDRL